MAASARKDALLVKVSALDTNYGILVVHAPHAKKVTDQGYMVFWLRPLARVRRNIDTRRVIMAGGVICAFDVKDRHKQQASVSTSMRLFGCETTQNPDTKSTPPQPPSLVHPPTTTYPAHPPLFPH